MVKFVILIGLKNNVITLCKAIIILYKLNFCFEPLFFYKTLKQKTVQVGQSIKIKFVRVSYRR